MRKEIVEDYMNLKGKGKKTSYSVSCFLLLFSLKNYLLSDMYTLILTSFEKPREQIIGRALPQINLQP